MKTKDHIQTINRRTLLPPSCNNRRLKLYRIQSHKSLLCQRGSIVKKPSGITAGNINQGPGSIAQLGGEHNSATVNNFGPPPVKFTSSVRDIIPPMDDGSDNPTPSAFKYEKEIVVNVDAPYTPVSVGVMCESWVLVAGLPLSKCYSEYIG